jgi:hypothetical protein
LIDGGKFPYLGQTFPGDPRYRVWICALLGMSDKLKEVNIPVQHKDENEGSLFFED